MNLWQSSILAGLVLSGCVAGRSSRGGSDAFDPNAGTQSSGEQDASGGAPGEASGPTSADGADGAPASTSVASTTTDADSSSDGPAQPTGESTAAGSERIRVTNCDNGNAVVLVTLDRGPNCNSVEMACDAPVLDMSHDAMVYLFDRGIFGGCDHQPVVVERVDADTPLGPV